MQKRRPLAFYTYIVANQPNGTLYTGHTDDLAKRIWQHKEKAFRGFTAKYGVMMLAWYEVHDTRESAFRRSVRSRNGTGLGKSGSFSR